MVNVGILGAGRIAQDVHCPQVSSTKGLRLHSICDITPARLEWARAEYPKARISDDDEAFAADPDLDLVVVCSPTSLHTKHALLALHSGKHVVVEKPMATEYEDCLKMIEAARKNDLLLTVFHNRRLDGDFLAVKKAVSSGALGDLFVVESRMIAGSAPVDYAVSEFRPRWRLEKKYGGGALYDWGSHLIDQVILLADSEPKSVWGSLATMKWGDEVDDYARVMIRFANGAVGEVEVSYVSTLGKSRWFVGGKKGTLKQSAGLGRLRMISFETGNEEHIEIKEGEWGSFYENLQKVASGKTDELLVPPEEAARVVRVIEAAMKSSRKHKEVALD
jgi:scyllo-inositol 2-dehydrogenase (NADP+)